MAAMWFPVACADDLVARHVFQGELNGVELALWRDDDGCVNAWENRCRHRSVRLSLGVNTGRRLRCQYHGWQYRSGDGQCVVVPAASQTPPPASVCARTFAVAERHGLIWANLHAPAGMAMETPAHWLVDHSSAEQRQLTLHSFVFHADGDTVARSLPRYVDCDTELDKSTIKVNDTRHATALSWTGEGGPAGLVFLLQPARAGKTIIHTLLKTPAVGGAENEAITSWRRRHHAAMGRLRHRLIGEGRLTSVPVPDDGFVAPPPQEPEARARARMLPARVTRCVATAEDIMALELEPECDADVGALADFMPGAHIDVTTPAGIVRQYSIVGIPGETHAGGRGHVPGVTLGVKLEPESRGGSASIHERLEPGQVLQVSRPKNHFRIANNKGALLLAGGIGVTPLLSMAAYMQQWQRDYALHYFVRGERHVAFPERLDALRHRRVHVGLTAKATQAEIASLLGAVETQTTDVYVCGPRPFLECVLACAREVGVDTARVHFELFSNTVSHEGDKPFRVRLARSGTELTVPAGVPLSDVLRDHGHAVETSCEQGVCGTCMVSVLEGEPEHRDVYLGDDEKRSGRCMQACVSRSRSDMLVLDL